MIWMEVAEKNLFLRTMDVVLKITLLNESGLCPPCIMTIIQEVFNSLLNWICCVKLCLKRFLHHKVVVFLNTELCHDLKIRLKDRKP